MPAGHPDDADDDDVDGTAVARERWLAADRAALWEQAEVVAVERAASGTLLRLRLPGVPDVLPGQYYLVRVALDAPPGAVEQAYSLCSSPHPPTPEVEIAVREVSGGRASPVLARRVEAGDLLQARGPFGFLTWTEDDPGPVGLVGAGTGVAPLVSIVRYAAARGLDVPMTMLCSSRNRESALLADALDALARRLGWLRVVHTFTRDRPGGGAQYERRIDAAMLAEVMGLGSHGETAPEAFYVAGPADMVLAVRAALAELGVSDGSIHTEDHA